MNAAVLLARITVPLLAGIAAGPGSAVAAPPGSGVAEPTSEGARNQAEYRPAVMRKTADGYEYSVNSGRPVFEILQLLSDTTGHPINYEDAPIWFPGELDDITAEVGSSPESVRLRGGRPVLVPRNRSVVWRDGLAARRPTLDRVEAAVRDLVAEQNRAQAGGRYRVLRDGGALHVVPAATRVRDGRWRDVMSLMDVHVTVPAGERTPSQQLRAILEAARHEARLTFVGIPFEPKSWLLAPAREYPAESGTAREALMRVLRGEPRPARWAALFDPLTQGYHVSFFLLADRTPLHSPAGDP